MAAKGWKQHLPHFGRTAAKSALQKLEHRAAKVRSPQHQMFDCGSIGLQDKVASSLQEIKFLNNGFKRFGPLFYGDSVLSYICYSKQPQH
jgi:hypothetical protein